MREDHKLAIDKALCISLSEREDRRRELIKTAQELNIDVEFVIVEKDRENPERGCFESHQRCARIAIERNYKRILILEDDACLEKEAYHNKLIKITNRFLTKNNPEIFYLGYILGKAWFTKFRKILGCRVAGAHAYIIPQHTCRKISKIKYDGEPIDELYKRELVGYAINPPILSQWPSTKFISDIEPSRSPEKNHNIMDEDYWRKQREKRTTRKIMEWTIRRAIKKIISSKGKQIDKPKT